MPQTQTKPAFDGPDATAEAPSGKDAAYENFPVGSWLLPAPLRPHVAIFYAFARAIDDIADSPDLPPEEKIARLDGFADVLEGGEALPAFAKATHMRQSLLECGVTNRHCLDLISAFKQDAVKTRYASWDELIDYCNRSAAPVGRYLLDLHGEDSVGYPYSDALCNALQVLNHLQDCQEDYRLLDRVYLPVPWFEQESLTVDALDGSASSPGMRRIIDRALTSTDPLIETAAQLPHILRNRRLAMESNVIVHIARKLAAHLRRDDPLAGRVALSKPHYLLCCLQGAGKILFRPRAQMPAP